jgi:enoyl-[acyl-carrier protein] reductase I
MGLLEGKRILITGVISNRSIAYGIAQACRTQGAELAFTYVGDRFKDRVTEFAHGLGSEIVIPCDVAEDEQIDATFATLRDHWDGLDGLVHSIGFAPREALSGDLLDGMSRENYRIAHDISAYSFPALAKAALPMMEGRQGSVLTLTYLGAEKAIPHYNMMGLAKASLEASVRYLATALGRRGIRSNGISAGPIKTLAASGIKDFSNMLKYVESQSPLGRTDRIEDVGNAASFLLSDLAAGVTGEILHVDCGFSNTVPGME